MGHTRPDQLKDLQDTLDEIRKWEGIKEKSPNIFYFKARPFLHFPDKDGRRWADVCDGETWGQELTIPFESSTTQRNSFLKEIRKRYQNLMKGKTK
jgi:hypothetical protein